MPSQAPLQAPFQAPSQALRWSSVLWSHLRKDLRIEWRSRDAINSMLFFALLVVVLFSMAFDPTAATSREIAAGVLCVATLFASVSALNQAWAREIRHQVLDALRMTPSDGAALFLAKVLANFFYVSLVQLVLGPIFFIFYNLHPLGEAWLLLLVLPLGTWALVSNGTFFAALSIRTRNRELLLPLILFPIFLPALLAMVLSVKTILTGDGSDPHLLWIQVLAGYDVIFTTISLLLFDTVLGAE
jgi:heme exporter protein B